MGKVKEPLPVKLVVGMISGEKSLFEQAEKKLTQEFGSVDFASLPLPFDCTDYYRKKMQMNLKRKFISFTSLIDAAKIVEIKLLTNQVEENYLYPYSRQRRLNIDPGYITLAKLVLTTSKNFQHRIYLAKGIYAEVTLRYKKGKGFTCWEWTYPDYRSKEYIEIFNHLRKIYCHQVLQDHSS